MSTHHNMRRFCLLALVPFLSFVTGIIPIPGLAQDRAFAVTPIITSGISDTLGFDGCQSPGSRQATVPEMQAFWNGSPYFDVYIYIGGTGTRATCGPGGVNASWVDQVTNIGFSVFPLWVGPTGNCGSSANRVSCNASTAFDQGFNDAQLAYTQFLQLGFAPMSDPNPIPLGLDMEGYTDGPLNRASVKAYVNGWTQFLHEDPAEWSVIYGSSVASHPLDWETVANPPDAVWLADPPANGIGPDKVWGVLGVSDSHWSNNQRYRQIWAGHKETRNGVTLNMDTDCANGYMAPTGRFDVPGSGPSVDTSCNPYYP